MFNIKLPKANNAFQKFYEKTGIRLTDEPLGQIPPEIERRMEELRNLAQRKPKKTIPELLILMKNYPDIPSIKNYLYISYDFDGQRQNAEAVLERTLKEHPDYVFGIICKILGLKTREELEAHKHLLGDLSDVRCIRPGHEAYHITEFTAYETAAAWYEAMTGNADSAMDRLETLIELGVEKPKLEEMARKIAFARIHYLAISMRQASNLRKQVASRVKVDFEATSQAPRLECPELEVFYRDSVKGFPEEVIHRIFQLPHEQLVADLERILEDSICRWDYFSKDSKDDENTIEFVIHALYFLGGLSSERSLQKVINLLRMGEGFTEFWFGDFLEQFLFPTLYALGENQLEALKNYVLEQDLLCWDRLRVSQIPSQVALHQPERRQEVVRWYEDVFTFLLENETDERLIDTDFIAHTVCYIVDFRGLELLPLIEKMWEKQWISKRIMGDLAEISKRIRHAPHPSEIKPLPENIIEYYSEAYLKRKVRTPMPEEILALNKRLESPAEKMVVGQFAQLMFPNLIKPPVQEKQKEEDYIDYEEGVDNRYESVKQVVNTSSKVGRNDPCPCGSGKKYKKCCLGK